LEQILVFLFLRKEFFLHHSINFDFILKAKRSLGQHFLIQPSIAQKIADSLSWEGYEHVLEVGPGQGILTKELIGKFALTAVETDFDLIQLLKEEFSDSSFRLIHADFLKTDIANLMDQRPFAIIGNFPYNISSQIVFKMLSLSSIVPELVGMFQLEMAQRIIASHGSKRYGIISVLTQAKYDGELLFRVGRKNFRPMPNVESAVIRLRKKKTPPDCDYATLRKLVKTSFSQRRKMLRNSLKSIISQNQLKDSIFKKRPEQLSVQEFIELTAQIEFH
jgi:16S rRNA (adenine1518-N6/adenine1519-N6)-dimethyltransferase